MGNIRCEICGAIIGSNDKPDDISVGICGLHTPAEIEDWRDTRDGIKVDKARIRTIYGLLRVGLNNWTDLTTAQKIALVQLNMEYNLLFSRLIVHILQGRIRMDD